jgi:hypothetical protein
MSDDDFEIVEGSGNIFRDFNHPNADLEQLRSLPPGLSSFWTSAS